VRGWQERAQDSAADVLERFADLPLAAVLHTDIARDGMLQGPNLAATRALAKTSPFPVIASGGVHSLDDLRALSRTRVIAGVIVGRALYAGAFGLAEALREAAAC
jgi:phosphoribosylformimino-5-aminoimidazole carboxamide ribotide isomerase